MIFAAYPISRRKGSVLRKYLFLQRQTETNPDWKSLALQ